MPLADSSAGGWIRTLDAIEASVTQAELLAATGEVGVLPAWRTPRDLGPLPEGLADRARLLLSRHEAVITRLGGTSAHIRHDLEFLLAMSGTTPASPPAFVDTEL